MTSNRTVYSPRCRRSAAGWLIDDAFDVYVYVYVYIMSVAFFAQEFAFAPRWKLLPLEIIRKNVDLTKTISYNRESVLVSKGSQKSQ